MSILYHSDFLNIAHRIDDNSVDTILADPPYGTTACKWDSIIPFEPMWKELKRIIKPNGAIVMTASQPFTSALVMSNVKMFKYCWVWVKDKPSNFALANKMPMKYHEDIVVFYNKQPTYNKQMQRRDGSGAKRCEYIVDNSNRNSEHILLKAEPIKYDPLLKNPSSVQKFSTGRRNDIKHPTQKPVALMEYLIKTYSNENDTILDFAMGSGTTGVACKNLNRNFIGIEKDKKYFKIAQERLNDTTT